MVQRFGRGARGSRNDTSGEGELHRSIGEIQGQLEMMREENARMLDDNRKMLEDNRLLLKKIDKVEDKLEPLPDLVKKHDARIDKLERFDGNIAAVVAFIGVAASSVCYGAWLLISNFSGVMSFARKMFGAP